MKSWEQVEKMETHETTNPLDFPFFFSFVVWHLLHKDALDFEPTARWRCLFHHSVIFL